MPTTTGNITITGPLALGSRGPDVRILQQSLNSGLQADGAFGLKTDTALRAFQRSKGLKPDGILGPLTAAALGLRYKAAVITPPAPPRPSLPREEPINPVTPGPPPANAIPQLVEAIIQGLVELKNNIIQNVLGLADLPGMVASEIRDLLSGPFQTAIGILRNSIRTATANIASAATIIASALQSAIQTVIAALQSIATLLGRLPDLLGLSGIIDRIRRIITLIRGIVDSIIDVIIRTIRGVAITTEAAVAFILRLFRSALITA